MRERRLTIQKVANLNPMCVGTAVIGLATIDIAASFKENLLRGAVEQVRSPTDGQKHVGMLLGQTKRASLKRLQFMHAPSRG